MPKNRNQQVKTYIKLIKSRIRADIVVHDKDDQYVYLANLKPAQQRKVIASALRQASAQVAANQHKGVNT